MYEGLPGYAVKSAGTSPAVRIRLNESHVGGADIIFVTETKHRRLLREKFGEALNGNEVFCLHIPGNYRYTSLPDIHCGFKKLLQVTPYGVCSPQDVWVSINRSTPTGFWQAFFGGRCNPRWPLNGGSRFGVLRLVAPRQLHAMSEAHISLKNCGDDKPAEAPKVTPVR